MLCTTNYPHDPNAPVGGAPNRNAEDSVIYRDTRGDFHMIFHFYGNRQMQAPDFGGHAHGSADGRQWTFSPSAAFGYNVSFQGGATAAEPPASYGFRQRPHVVLSSAGEITHLLNGVDHDFSKPSVNANGARCAGPSMTGGPCDHSWTIVQPVRTISAPPAASTPPFTPLASRNA